MKEEIKTRPVKDFRELVDWTVKNYPDNIAYRYKKDPHETDYQEKTFSQLYQDIRKLATQLIEMGLEQKRIAVIGNNRYEWCVTYLASIMGNMVIVPLDKLLPDVEIESLLKRSGAEAVVFEGKYLDCMEKIKQKSGSKLQYLIAMDETKKEDVLDFQELLKKGEQLLEKGDTRYDNMQVDAKKMSIMLFTSGTTNIAKAVMLSQENICSDIEGMPRHVKLYPSDRLLSFLPLHHTFECTITFLYALYSGATVCFCDGLKYIQKNLKEYEITVFVAVPLVLETMYKKIQKAIEEQGKTKLITTMAKISNVLLKCKIDLRKQIFKPVLEQLVGKLRIVLYGAAPMDKQTIVGYNNLGVELIQGYGLTETSPVVSC